MTVPDQLPSLSPSREDAVVRAASEVVGGPAGAHLARVTRRGLVGLGLFGALPLLSLGSCVSVGLALLTRAHCRTTDWKSPDQFVHACYSDVPTLVATHAAAGQPPLTAILLRVLAVLTSSGQPQARPAFDASVVLAALALIIATWCLARTAEPRRWDAALLALCPAVVTAGLVSVDLVAVAAVAGGLLAWARGRPLVAGIFIGLAAGVRPVVAVLLIALWLGVLVRDSRVPDERAARGRLSTESAPAALATGAAVATGIVLTLLARIPATGLPGGSHWFSVSGGAGYGSVWLLPSLAGRTLSAHAVELLCALALVVVLLAGTAAAARTAATSPDGRAHLPTVGLVLLVGVTTLGPSVPVQATLVVIPLAALAIPRWGDNLTWALAEVVYATVTWLYLYAISSPDQRGAPPWMYAIVTVVRLGALAWLAVAAVRRVGTDADGAGVIDPLRAPGQPCGQPGRSVLAAR